MDVSSPVPFHALEYCDTLRVDKIAFAHDLTISVTLIGGGYTTLTRDIVPKYPEQKGLHSAGQVFGRDCIVYQSACMSHVLVQSRYQVSTQHSNHRQRDPSTRPLLLPLGMQDILASIPTT